MEERLITEENWEQGRVFINGQSLSGDFVMNSKDNAYSALSQFQNNYNNFDPATILAQAGIDIKSKYLKLDSLEIENISILKLRTNKCGIGLDVHFKFTIDENEYWACFRKYNRDSECKFDSEFSSLVDGITLIKVIGILKQQLFVWFRPKQGVYKVSMSGVSLLDENGMSVDIPLNAEVKVMRSFLDKKESVIEYAGKNYKLVEPAYYYFNYWFKPKAESPF
jgi:hypothetical protein